MYYLSARMREARKESIYRAYVTDMMYYNNQNKTLTARYIDILENKPTDDRSGDEIAADVITRLGLKVI